MPLQGRRNNLNMSKEIIRLIGAVLVAAITTMGTIYVSRSGIAETKQKVDTLKEQADTLVLSTLPVGSVVPSLLTPGQFAKEAGDPPTFDLKQSKWTLADDKGRVPGTHYAELTGNSPIPDLRGLFLRGKNDGRMGQTEIMPDRGLRRGTSLL